MCVQYKIEIDIRHADYTSILYGIALLLHIVRVFVKTNKKKHKKINLLPIFCHIYFLLLFYSYFSFFLLFRSINDILTHPLTICQDIHSVCTDQMGQFVFSFRFICIFFLCAQNLQLFAATSDGDVI